MGNRKRVGERLGVDVHDQWRHRPRHARRAFASKNSGQFFALDAKTGKTLWTSAPRQATNAAIVRAGDLLFVLKDDADLMVTRSGPKGFETVRTYTMADSATWAEPVVSGNRLFVKDVASLALWTLN